MNRFSYRPDIDGLRAIAVIPVIAFHLGVAQLPGGFLGVDVFFVISGYLITSIINNELSQGAFSLPNFYARRIRRILPAMLTVTSMTLAATFLLIFKPEQQTVGRQAIAALMSVANIYFWLTAGDYWGPQAEKSPFLHTWSLSVEEQFYIIFPVAIWALSKLHPKRIKPLLSLAVILSLALFLWGSKHHPTSTFYLLPTRIWEMATGALLATTIRPLKAEYWSHMPLGLAGLILVIASYLFTETLGVGVLFAVFGTGMLVACGNHGLAARVLASPSLVHIGKLSYSLYLWHWPILVFARELGVDLATYVTQGLLCLLMYGLALVTYSYVESPLRRCPRTVPYIATISAAVTCLATAMAISPNSYDASLFNTALFCDYSPAPDWKPGTGSRWLNICRTNPGYEPDALRNGGIRIGDSDKVPEMIVLGDSHASMWSPAIATIAEDAGIPTAFFCQCGERWWEDKFDSTKSFLYRYIDEWRPKVLVVSLSWRNKQEQEISRFLKYAGVRGAAILLLEDPPWFLPCGKRSSIQWLASQGIQPEPGFRQFMSIVDETPDNGGRKWVRALAAAHEHTRVVELHDTYTSSAGVLVLDGKDAIYIDDNHLSCHGAYLAVTELRTAILDAFCIPCVQR